MGLWGVHDGEPFIVGQLLLHGCGDGLEPPLQSVGQVTIRKWPVGPAEDRCEGSIAADEDGRVLCADGISGDHWRLCYFLQGNVLLRATCCCDAEMVGGDGVHFTLAAGLGLGVQ